MPPFTCMLQPFPPDLGSFVTDRLQPPPGEKPLHWVKKQSSVVCVSLFQWELHFVLEALVLNSYEPPERFFL